MKSAVRCLGFLALLLGPGCASTTESEVLPADEQFATATGLFEDGEYAQAVTAFQAFVFNYPHDPRVAEARWMTADSYLRLEDWATAAQEHLNFQRDFPDSDRADDALYQAGRAYQEMSLRPELDQRDTERAINVYERLLVEYPASDLVNEARTRVKDLRNKLAEKVYLNAEFYFDNEKYKAAEIYLTELIAKYPQSDWLATGYALLARTLCEQGLEDRAVEVVARLDETFPESSAAREATHDLPDRCRPTATAARAGEPSGDGP